MESKAYFDSNGQLMMPPVQGSEGLSGYSSSSVLLPNDVSYENLSAYIATVSHLYPNMISGNLGSPISNNSTNSGLSAGASSLITNATYGANFQRSNSFNIEPYYNLPSSPSSVSSRKMSGLALEGIESHLNQINQVACRRERLNADTSSLFKGKELELLEYLPQMSKKPRLDPNLENALHQYIIQQVQQKQGPLEFQKYNQQLKTLLQHHELQKQKQKEVLQSQYVSAPTQKQMRLYLQQLAKSSVPAIRPILSGICNQRLMQFLYHLQHRPSDNNITYWRKFVAEYYAPGAKKRWCFSLYTGVGERSHGVFSQLAMDAWRCDLCGSRSGKGFEANFEILSRLYKTYFESGVLEELLFLDLPHENILPSRLISLRYEKAVQETVYEKFRVVREGQLHIIFRYDLKILAWEFCARCHDEFVPRRLIAPQVNELAQAAEKCQVTGGPSKVAVQKLHSTCKMFVAAEKQLTRNLDSVLVNDLGFPKRYIRLLQTAEIVNSMKDLISFTLDNKLGPIESLAKYSREGSTSNTQKKQAETPASSHVVPSGSKRAYGGMSCHQKIPNSTPTIPEMEKPPGFTDPIQSSPVSGASSSAPLGFDNKTQEQMIDKILQKMESNSREKANLTKNVKVKVEASENLEGAPTAVWKSVPKNAPKIAETSKSTSNNVPVKQEPNDEDIYMDLYLPEAIRDVDRSFFRVGALDDEWNDVGGKSQN